MKHRAEKIIAIAKKREEEKAAAFNSKRANLEDRIIGMLGDSSQRATFAEYCQNQPAHLQRFNRDYTCAGNKVTSTRGSTRGNRGNPIFDYVKPTGYFGYAIEAYEGPEIGRNNNEGEWVVAYHGTPFRNIGSILSDELKPGSRQAYKSYTNINGMSKGGDIGNGIYLSPDPSQAESYGSSNGFYCMLQCRVNPKAVRFSSGHNRGFWIVPDGSEIIPYRLLFKLY